MVTSALVVTLEGDARKECAVVEALASDGRLTLGERVGVRLPVVAETNGLGAAEALAEELLALEGVFAVDVVLVDFDPEGDVDGPPRLGRQRRATGEAGEARDEARDEEGGHGPA